MPVGERAAAFDEMSGGIRALSSRRGGPLARLALSIESLPEPREHAYSQALQLLDDSWKTGAITPDGSAGVLTALAQATPALSPDAQAREIPALLPRLRNVQPELRAFALGQLGAMRDIPPGIAASTYRSVLNETQALDPRARGEALKGLALGVTQLTPPETCLAECNKLIDAGRGASSEHNVHMLANLSLAVGSVLEESRAALFNTILDAFNADPHDPKSETGFGYLATQPSQLPEGDRLAAFDRLHAAIGGMENSPMKAAAVEKFATVISHLPQAVRFSHYVQVGKLLASLSPDLQENAARSLGAQANNLTPAEKAQVIAFLQRKLANEG
ncbi:hypothetical protein P0D69_19500 [Paraburkholderia sediminicola]|uniref:hypothetical protein n=1 Tax=Paraburkholderia sediminicola TaxID=458836 RepID=UPI0038B80409